jgi:hypothetical protein
MMVVVLALIALDLLDDPVNSWFNRHSFTTDVASTLLGLGVAVLVIDRVAEQRKLRERAQVMAAQAAMVTGQAQRANRALRAALDGTGERDAAADELRTYMTMLMIAGPVLMEGQQTRHFLEQCQRLAGEQARALTATRTGERPAELEDRLGAAVGGVRAAVAPLLEVLDAEERSALFRSSASETDTPDPSAGGVAAGEAPAERSP